MIAVRFHGRGGQGAVIASKILAHACFHEGWDVQAFPAFGAERTGAPVTAFLRLDRRPITLHCHITHPDIVVVLEPLLVDAVDVTSGLADHGLVLVNAAAPPARLATHPSYRLATCDATAIATAHGLGSRTHPIVNTAMAGAFAATTGLVSLDAVLDAIAGLVPAAIEANQAAAREAAARATAEGAGLGDAAVRAAATLAALPAR
jgi:2-oxoacid:acceptor oxidoreductase gamma subunit (pyruvate/2-ketoisovalerate family)